MARKLRLSDETVSHINTALSASGGRPALAEDYVGQREITEILRRIASMSEVARNLIHKHVNCYQHIPPTRLAITLGLEEIIDNMKLTKVHQEWVEIVIPVVGRVRIPMSWLRMSTFEWKSLIRHDILVMRDIDSGARERLTADESAYLNGVVSAYFLGRVRAHTDSAPHITIDGVDMLVVGKPVITGCGGTLVSKDRTL